MNRTNRCRIATWVIVLTVMVLAMATPAQVQNNHEAEILLQEAKHRALVDGDLEQAIELCRKIVSEYSSNRAVVAKALVQMGQCYEKLGQSEARKAYERVLLEYADQTQAVSTARSRLSVLDQTESAAKTSEGVTVRLVWKGRTAWDVSPSGRYLTFVDYATGDLAIHELATSTDRRLTHTGGWNERSKEGVVEDGLVFSPDSSKIAYAWGTKEGVDLRIVGLEEPEPLVLCRSNSDKTTWPIAWSPDGKEILATSLDGGLYGLVSVSDGSSRILKSLKDTAIQRACFSPDGRYFVYDSPHEKDSPGCDIFLFTLDGEAHSRLVEHPADDLVLGWTPDGSGILFASNRQGAYDAWLIQVADGKPQGEPRLVKPDLGQIIPLRFTEDGSYYYCVALARSDVFVATLELETGKVVDPPKKVSLQREGSSGSPEWSADGRYLAYVSQRFGPTTRDFVKIVIQDMKTGEYRELTTSLRNIRPKGIRWSPDGRSFIMEGWKGAGSGGGIYRIDVQTGEESLVKQVAGFPEWTPDGKGIVFLLGERILLRELETGKEQELLVGTKEDILMRFALSPDGRQLAWTAEEEDTKSVVLKVVAIDGETPRELARVQPPDYISRLEWVPDGSRILFEKLRDKTALWQVPAWGGVPRETGLAAPGGTGEHLFPRMHPDGRRIAFTSASGAPFVQGVWVMENFLPKVKAGK